MSVLHFSASFQQHLIPLLCRGILGSGTELLLVLLEFRLLVNRSLHPGYNPL